MTTFSFLATKVITALLLPPAGPILLALVCLLLSVLVEDKRWKRINSTLAVFFLAVLYLLCLPIVGNMLMVSLDRYPPISDAKLSDAQAIVILSGGFHFAPEYGGDTVDAHTLARLRYGVRLARRSNLPVLVTGGAPYGGTPEGKLMRDVLAQDYGVSAHWVETASSNTSENASGSALLLKSAGISRVALVSHSWHLARAVPLFEREGFLVIPAPTVFATVPEPTMQSFLPGDGALSRVALREYLGLLFNYASDLR